MTGLIAILRGVTPAEVVGIGRALVDAGFPAIEVPLNSPEPFESVRLLADAFGEWCEIARAPCSPPKTSAGRGRPERG